MSKNLERSMLTFYRRLNAYYDFNITRNLNNYMTLRAKWQLPV